MRHSIQLKILISFSVIIFIGLSALLFVSYKLTEQNDNNIIRSDMVSAKKNLDHYLKQYLLINNMDFSEASLLLASDDIAMQLSLAIDNKVDIYSMRGVRLSHNPQRDSQDIMTQDLINAMDGRISYVTGRYGDQVKVYLSYPIKTDEGSIGILRYTKDYTQLFENSRRFRNIINTFAVAIFTVIFIAASILSRQITKPIKRLAVTTEQVSNGDFDVDIYVDSEDEIGDLAKRFRLMVKRIEEQIGIIQDDRDALKESQAQNKVFFDNVTHELKTPITVIMGYAQAMKENGFSDRVFFDKAVSYISNESKRLNNMVVELLELSKTSSANFNYNFVNVDIGELVRQTCDEMNIKAQKYNIDIHCRVGEAIKLKGDRDRLKEVLINLLDNSLKYGYVNSHVEVAAYKEKNIVYIRIKDEGEGIAEENIKKLFDPFYRVSKKSSPELGSAGLGLTIVKNIVEKHGGTIELISIAGEGTEAIVRFEVSESCEN